MHTYHTEEQLKDILEEYLIYLRKSRSDNPKETVEETLARHEEELQTYAKENLGGYIKEDNIYREVVSGGEDIEARPEFVKVLKRMEKGDIKGVIVVDTARLSRAGIYGAGDVINAFLYTNTLIMTPVKTYDLSQKFDKKFIEMEMIKSNDYLDYVKEVLGNGRLRSLRSGCFIAKEAPFGFAKEKLPHKGHKLVPVAEEVEIVQQIFKMYIEEGLSIHAIVIRLKKEGILNRGGSSFTRHSLGVMLSNHHYLGKIVWAKRKNIKILQDGKLVKRRIKNPNPLIFDGLHDSIISEETFAQAQEKLKATVDSMPRTTVPVNPLAGLIRCKSCGRVMIRQHTAKERYSTIKRAKEPNKEKLSKVLREAKTKSGLTQIQIAEKLGANRAVVSNWFSPTLSRFRPSKGFSSHWLNLKALLNITTDEFDEDILTYVSVPQPAFLVCHKPGCKMSSSQLHIVEEELLTALKNYLHNYRYFLDNYENEIVKEVKGNTKEIKTLKAKIEKYTKAKKNALRNYNLEDITREEYLEEKKELESYIKTCEERIAKLEDNEEEDKLIKYRRAVPILEKCLEQYGPLSIEEKNSLLKAIIKNVEYSKSGKDLKLEVELLI